MSATSIHPPVVRRPPGPSRASALGLLPRMMRNRLEVMAWAVAEYGEAVRVPLGPKTLYLFNHPDHARHVLADNAANYTKGIGLTHARRVIGDGLLTSEGELWRKQRRVIQPVFQAKRLARQVDAIALEAEALVDRLREHSGQGPVDIRQEMTALALGVLGRTLIDADLGAFEAVGEAFETVQDQAMFEMMSLGAVPLWLPLPRTLRFRKAKRYLQEVTDSLAADRRKNPNGFGDDIVSRLIESVADEPDQQVGRERMRDELVTLLLAGHETTASTLSWALHLLDQNPEVRERVHEEAVEVFSRGPLDSAALHGFTYTSMVLEEVMRMYPPVWLLTRIAREADEIGGFAVPAGADVIISPYLLQRSEKWWPDPDKFDPERFASDRRAGRERYSYIPFGAGPRFCVGNNLGMMEATIVLAALCRDLRLASVPDQVVEGEPMLTLRVRGGLPMTVTAR
ncbi:cytochrome P450 [Catenulispora acidiphila DSM 44928]|uniref:Cytochrome P450 n=1 Tax=Catenulispora acidiphila (strain DSM 44928 / JCM 14897 / NBRC 102108 / NRRL B-24433 / ID139908) TaxID=479433 RepID=C7PWE5_CATAD|nr:cytochrome P450 [Catenulispora acidiphila]ACU75225.1 cytochrome P450 [Catenulispora acidiphila DSM 44928]